MKVLGNFFSSSSYADFRASAIAFPFVSARYPHPSSTVSTIGFGRFAIARQNTWICWTNHFVSVTIFIGESSWLMKKIHVRLLQDQFAALSSTMAKSFVIAPLGKFLRKWRTFLVLK